MELHRSGTFVMVNVADAGTARAVCDAGAAAIATTSGGHAATIDRRDASSDVTMEEHAQHTEVLVRAASVPCNVDAENGYGHEPEEMLAAVQRFADTGAAGMGIEDWSGDQAMGLYDRARAIARTEAAVEASQALERPFVITGRIDVLLYGLDGGPLSAAPNPQRIPARDHTERRFTITLSRRHRAPASPQGKPSCP